MRFQNSCGLIRTIVVLCISFVLSISLAETVFADGVAPSGSGTESDPFQIESFANLQYLSQTPAIWGKCFIQTADIDAGETKNLRYGFSAIGAITTKENPNPPFSGSYNGQGYVISNLTIKYVPYTGYLHPAGFFGSTSVSARIENVFLENISVQGEDEVGALAGLASGHFLNCCATGRIEGRQRGWSVNAGGLFGRFFGTGENCFSRCVLSGSNVSLGGFASVIGRGATVKDCYSACRPDASGVIAGGFSDNSASNAKISNCYWDKQLAGPRSACGEGKTTEEMKALATYAGWDFKHCWQMNQAAYPTLRYMPDFDIFPAAISFGKIATKTVAGLVIKNTGMRAVQVTAAPTGSGFTCDGKNAVQLTIPGKQARTIQVACQAKDFSPGPVSVMIQCVGDNGTTRAVPVDAQVMLGPILTISPQTLTAKVDRSANAEYTISLENTGDMPFEVTLNAPVEPWLAIKNSGSTYTIGPKEKMAPGLSVNTADMQMGHYAGSISFVHTASNLSSPATVPVELEIAGSTMPGKIFIALFIAAFSAMLLLLIFRGRNRARETH